MRKRRGVVITQMNAVIATRPLWRVCPDGTEITYTVEIGTPTKEFPDNPDSLWYCPARLVGLEGFEEVMTVYSTDSVGAISAALSLMAHLLTALPFYHEILQSEMPNCGFAVMERPAPE